MQLLYVPHSVITLLTTSGSLCISTNIHRTIQQSLYTVQACMHSAPAKACLAQDSC
jgi:hypothetical protein